MSASAARPAPAELRITREAIVSGAINAVLSLAFFLLAFDTGEPVAVWGWDAYAFDFLPQGFAIGLMATLVPGLLARRTLAASGPPAPPSVGSVVRRSLVHALLAMVAGGGAWAAILSATSAETIAWAPALALKLLYGGALGASVTALSLRAMLR